MPIDTSALIAFGTELVLTLGLLALGLLAVRWVARRVVDHVQAADKTSEERKKQLQTVVQVASWGVRAVFVAMTGMMLLGRFVDITPLLTSVGVAGLAVSLGAQTLIKDYIGGLIVLIENQYAVGDVIKVDDVSGQVERLTLRATHVRDINGSLHVVPNGDVRTVANVTREWSRALVDLGVAYEEDLDRVTALLEEEAAQFAQQPDVAAQIVEPPTVIGPLSLGDWAVNLRVMVKTLPGKQWGVAMALRKRLLAACERENVTLPYPRQEVIVRSGDAPPHDA